MGSAWGRIPGPDYRDPAGALAAGQRTPGDLELGARAVALLHQRQVFPVARPRGREIAGLLPRAGEPEPAAGERRRVPPATALERVACRDRRKRVRVRE